MSVFKKIREGFEERAREMHKRSMAIARADELLNELCERFLQIGVNGTVHLSGSPEETMGRALTDNFLGYVKIEGRDIDLVQVESGSRGGPGFPGADTDSAAYGMMVFYYHYVVRANVKGLYDRLRAELKPIKKGFLSREVVDFRWEGGEIAERLNSDVGLRNMLLREGLNQLPNLEVESHERPRQVSGTGKPPQAFLEAQASFNQCVRITKRPRIPSFSELGLGPVGIGMQEPPRVGVELPTRETFEIYDKIAQHIHRIATARP